MPILNKALKEKMQMMESGETALIYYWKVELETIKQRKN